VNSTALLIIQNGLRSRFAQFKPGTDFLNLLGLFFYRWHETSNRRFQFLYLTVLFEKFVEQHGVYLIIARSHAGSRQRRLVRDNCFLVRKVSRTMVPCIQIAALLGSQCCDRIHARGAVSREETSKECCTREHQSCSNECQRIARTYVIQDLGQNAPRSE